MEDRESLISRASSTRMTPNSSNSSTSYALPSRGPTPGYRGVSTGGSLLQERLRERDAERRKSIHFVDKAVQSSPARSLQTRDEKRPSSSGLGVKGMGVKQWEEQTSTLHKQNYNLKLELFHRRDRQSKLEAELAAAQKIIQDQAEYQEMNDTLMIELERRDQAVDEAINLITSLEEQVEFLREENHRLGQGRGGIKTFDDEYKMLSTRIHQRSNSLPQEGLQTLKPRPLPRIPSFLSDQSEGTEALRSLYTKCAGASESNLSKLDEEEDEEDVNDRIDSPRLSVLSRLSESSFISVYGDKHAHENSTDDPESGPLPPSVLDWVEKAPMPNITSWPSPTQSNQYTSMDNVVQIPLEKRSIQDCNTLVRNTHELDNSVEFNEFRDRHTLPPTPDTCRTGKLRMNSRNSIEALNHPSKALVRYFSCPSRSSLPIRPLSACETITSRRHGSGWDTPTETDSASIIQTEDDACTISRPNRIKTPTLFSFNEPDWERGAMCSHEPNLPPKHRRRHSSLLKHSSSEDMPRKSSNTTKSELSERDTSDVPKSTVSSDHNSYLDRRQSQDAAEETEHSHSIQAIAVQPSPTWRRNPISLTLARFRRNDLSLPNTHISSAKSRSLAKSQQNNTERHATPPPIPRHREVTPSYRPVSAGSGKMHRHDFVRDVIQEKRDERYRRISACGPGSFTAKEVQFAEAEREEEDHTGKGVRKWLGLGVGSLRRS